MTFDSVQEVLDKVFVRDMISVIRYQTYMLVLTVSTLG